MPHRTVFQVGKNHVHPFTMFLGGVVVGSIATGTIAWTWANTESTDIEGTNLVKTRNTPSATPATAVEASPSPAVSF